ncbi:MAG: tetratricopeptide repeat protein [Bacteroidales bacterium]|nr:tetratricopeptide repeat protein [Bacteroidales bacterium]
MLYSCFIFLYTLAIRIAAATGNKKAAQWVAGRRHLMSRIAAETGQDERRFWIHCASLGEFEQGRPLIEALREQHPGHKIVLTFFSPSGYEIRKNYAQADYVWYLPADTRANARRFVQLIRPEKAFFIKYEFWRNMLAALQDKNIPTFLVSANFRPGQVFFKWYGGWFRKMLHMFSHLFVQNERSQQLLEGIGIRNVTVTGDTRFDRVCRIAAEAPAIAAVERFAAGRTCIVAGSSWPPDEALLIRYLNTSDRPLKWIIAPHEIDEAHVQRILDAIRKKAVRYTQAGTAGDLSGFEVMIIDNMGMLSAVYQYAAIAYIGGGFGRGIHNTLEAAVYGIPVIFGPAYTGFQEAVDLIACGGARTISDYEGLEACLNDWLDHAGHRKDAGDKAGRFVGQGKGATAAVLRKVFAGLALLLCLAGCSTQRNTPFSRSYHSVTTKYNILFNAQEQFRAGMEAVANAYQEDYTRPLPLFPYESVPVTAGAESFETAVQKAETAVSLHSIKAKPDIGQKNMTAAEQRFYAKNEFNPYIAQCYLLSGKSYFYLQDYYNAIKTFDRITEIFPQDPIVYTSELWRVRTLLVQKDFKQAQSRLQALLDDRSLPDRAAFRTELRLLQADLLLQQEDFDQVLPMLEELQHSRAVPGGTKHRIGYLLAQLYALKGDNGRAGQQYRQVARSGAPEAMRFAAQMEHAKILAAQGDRETIKHDLSVMAKRPRNQSRRNQIYYALANVYAEEGRLDEAVPLYCQAAALTRGRDPLRGESCRRVADFFFDRKQYETAGAYYDSTLQAITTLHPQYAEIQDRAKNRRTLMRHLEAIQREDSLQRMAAMPEEELESLIEQTIGELREKEQKAAEAEQARLRQYYNQRARQSGAIAGTENQWYFYSNTAKSRGANEFALRWGKRTLEDDWRRSNRDIVYRTPETAAAAEADTTQQTRITDTHEHDFYTQDLPRTEEALALSHRKIQEALAGSADIYDSFLGDAAAAVKQYEELLSRYPESDYGPYAYFALTRLYTSLGDTERATASRRTLNAVAPGSVYARMLDDPEFLARRTSARETAEQWYRQTYDKYQQREDDAVIAMADQAFNLFTDDVSLPQFAYLRALSASRRSQNIDTLRTEMRQVIERYPREEVAAAAADILSAFANYQTTAEMAGRLSDTGEVDSLQFTCDRARPQIFGWYLSAQEDLNQLVFDLTDFTVSNYPGADLEISRTDMPREAVILTVSPFRRIQDAEKYYLKFAETPAMQEHLRGEGFFFLITEEDLRLLESTGAVQSYLRSFRTGHAGLFREQ